jgi:hypothetical protein
MNRPTVCITARFLTLDLPWYAEWLEYHDRLGIDHFYLHYFDDHYLSLSKVLSYFPKEKVTLLQLPKSVAQMDFIGRIPRRGNEEYLLHIDSDEFLALPPGVETIGDYLESLNRPELIRIPWMMCPWAGAPFSSLSQQSRQVPSYGVTQYKSLASSAIAAGCGDSHEFFLRRQPSSECMEKHGRILHFASRGIEDTYLRCRDQALTNNHGGDPEKLLLLMDPERTGIRIAEIPRRILAALGEVSCVNPRVSFPLSPTGCHGTNSGLLAELLSPSENELFSLRWSDLIRARMFDGFCIRSFPKWEIWNFLEPRLEDVIPLTKP